MDKSIDQGGYRNGYEERVLNTKAVISLVLGCVSLLLILLTLIGLVIAIIGFFVSYVSLKEIHKTNQQGYGLAVAGLTCNTLAIIIPLLMLIVSLLFFTPAEMRMF
ncbi:DUF4190 domain-containing protein [Alkalihalophilus sp. As8PL]|uniref:DUF4190 domain-containing protein n=1 Tax=Alkalihalophilus sp. As8PL TaxID=3237103 RepID=A0AB39BVF1_9BACI